MEQVVVEVLQFQGMGGAGLKEAPSEGVLIHGLFLEGCAWSRRQSKLVDSERARTFFRSMPKASARGAGRSEHWI